MDSQSSDLTIDEWRSMGELFSVSIVIVIFYELLSSLLSYVKEFSALRATRNKNKPNLSIDSLGNQIDIRTRYKRSLRHGSANFPRIVRRVRRPFDKFVKFLGLENNFRRGKITVFLFYEGYCDLTKSLLCVRKVQETNIGL